MAHHIGYAVGQLILRQSKEQFRVDDAEQRAKMRAAIAILQLLFLVGDHGVTAGLAARGRDGQDGGNRQRALDSLALLIYFPNISFIINTHGNRLGRVDNTAAADCQDQFDILSLA